MATRVYFKHKSVDDVFIPYDFQCESCMKKSGDLKAHIVGDEAIYTSNYSSISDDKANKLQEEAHKNLVRKLKEVYKDVKEKEIYCTEFKDECPHCHKSQSWGVSGLKKKRFDTPIVILILGVIFFVIALIGHFASTTTEISLSVAFGCLGVGVLAAAVSLIWNTIKINQKLKEVSSNGAKYVPNINWDKVKKLIDEE